MSQRRSKRTVWSGSHLSAWASPPPEVLDPHWVLEGNTTRSLTESQISQRPVGPPANTSPAAGSDGPGSVDPGPASTTGSGAATASATGSADRGGSAAGSAAGPAAAAALCGSVYL